jgi:Rhodococcus equi virulence-associated protein
VCGLGSLVRPSAAPIGRRPQPRDEGAPMSASHPTAPAASAVSNEVFAKDFSEAFKGALDDDKLAAALNAITSATTAYPAAAWFTTFLFYMHCECQITGDTPRFRGNAGGVFLPPIVGVGGSFGNLFTDDKQKLYQQTTTLEVHCAAVYVGMTFWDSNSNLLGHYEAGGIGSLGIGGGTGTWSP